MIIDSHHHWIPPESVERINEYLRPGEKVVKDGDYLRIRRGDVDLFTLNPRYTDIQLKLKEMDAAGIDMAVLSTACWQEWNTMEMAPRINDAMAEIQAKYPHRFIALAHVPPFGEGVVAELERAVKMGLKGAMLTTNFDGKYPDDEAYRPFFQKAEELEIPVFFHAAIAPTEHSILEKYGVMRSLGRLLDHTLVAARVLYGVAKDFPRLKFLHGHIGGSFFIIKERLLDVKWFGVEEQPYEEIIDRQFFFDTAPAWWKRSHVECAVDNLGVDHILLGSDYPVLPRFLPDSVEIVRQVRLSEQDKRKILWENAVKFFNLEGPAQ